MNVKILFIKNNKNSTMENDHSCCIIDIPDIYSAIIASCQGHLDCLKYILHECKVDVKGDSSNYDSENSLKGRCCSYAARYGHLDIIKYLHQIGAVMHGFACSWAAYNGHLDCLKYLHESGCEWDITACMEASTGDRLECLKYAYENGCRKEHVNYPATEVYTRAAHSDNLDCLKYAMENIKTKQDVNILDDGVYCGVNCLKFWIEKQKVKKQKNKKTKKIEK
jgi:ankyrin repeat protein